MTVKTIHFALEKKDLDVLHLGATLTDDTTVMTDYCDKSITIPPNLDRIDVIFNKNETYIYQIKFYTSDGKILRTVDDKKRKKPGRTEIFLLMPGERLLGCEMLEEGFGVCIGVVWLKYKPM